MLISTIFRPTISRKAIKQALTAPKIDEELLVALSLGYVSA